MPCPSYHFISLPTHLGRPIYQWRESDQINIEDTARKLIDEGYFGDSVGGGEISETRAKTGAGVSHGLSKGEGGRGSSGEDDSDDNELFGVDDNDADDNGTDDGSGNASGVKTVEIDVTGSSKSATIESGVQSEVGLESVSKSSVLAPRDVIIHVEKDAEATLRHGDMTLVGGE